MWTAWQIFPRLIDYIEFLMSEYFTWNIYLWLIWSCTFRIRYVEPYNLMNHIVSSLTCSRLLTSAESTTTSLPCQGLLSLLEKFVKSFPREVRRLRGYPDHHLHHYSRHLNFFIYIYIIMLFLIYLFDFTFTGYLSYNK